MGIEQYFDGGPLLINFIIIIIPLMPVFVLLKQGRLINVKAISIITVLYWCWFGYFYFIYNLTPFEIIGILPKTQSIEHYRIQRAVYNADKATQAIERSKKNSLQEVCKTLLSNDKVYSISQCYMKYANNAENLPYDKGNEMYNLKVSNLIKYNRMEKRLNLYKSQFESVLPMLEINKNLKGLKIGTIQQEIFSNLKEFENSIGR